MIDQNEIFEQIISLAKRRVSLEMKYFAIPLGQLKTEVVSDEFVPTSAVDGNCLYYNADWILKKFCGNEGIERQMVHSLIHCVFRHYAKQTNGKNKRLWDIACDIFTENIIDDFTQPVFSKQGKNERIKVYDTLKNDVKILTAERIFAYLKETDSEEETLKLYEDIFTEDSHLLWDNSDFSADLPKESEQFDFASNAELWKNVEQSLLENLNRDVEQSLLQNNEFLKQLKVDLSEKYDYEKLLQRFFARREIIKSSDDEFDYIYYCYGLQAYKNLPLIEYLEYRDKPVVEDIVVAIDTSMSTQGNLVLSFLRQTYAVIEQIYENDSTFRLVIMQCDCAVKDEKIITSHEEFENLMQNFTLIGGGGTDFRPVFERVNKLSEDKTFNKIKGLLYFTDGKGVFPKIKPPYETVFVFLDNEKNDYGVPVWANKIIIDEDELNEYHRSEKRN